MDPIFQQLHHAIAQKLAGMDARSAAIHPGGNREQWSAQEIIEHLLLTYRSTDELIRHRMEKARPLLAKPTLRERVIQFAVCRVGFFPEGRKAPGAVTPRPDGPTASDGAALAFQLQAELEALDRSLSEVERIFGRKPIATHFALGPLTAHQWREFHLVHGLHHVKQLQRIRSAMVGSA